MEKKYMSDEELQRLINEVERTPLLAAPSYMKTEILHKADRIAAQPAPEKITGHQALRPSWRFAFYSLKVGLGTAAAVFVLLYMPMGHGEFPDLKPKFQVETRENLFSGFTSAVDRKTNEFCGRLSEWTNIRF